jgi:hypothetical protein
MALGAGVLLTLAVIVVQAKAVTAPATPIDPFELVKNRTASPISITVRFEYLRGAL